MKTLQMKKKTRIVLFGLVGSFTVMTAGCFQPTPVTQPAMITTENIAVYKTTTLSQPQFSEAAILVWANEAIVAALTYSFANYQQHLERIQQYFTPTSWQGYKSGLFYSGTLDKVISQKLVAAAVATRAPIITREGLSPEGVYFWEIKMPVLITYQNADYYGKQHAVVKLRVVRVPGEVRPKGIAIKDFVVQTKPYGVNERIE